VVFLDLVTDICSEQDGDVIESAGWKALVDLRYELLFSFSFCAASALHMFSASA
jgi:hypothetical protein